jgi:cell division septum initiation protein DivIVA
MTPGGGEDQVRTRTGFDLAWRGFDRAQVTEFAEQAEAELRRVTAERDALARRATALAQQNRELRAKIDRISRTPIAPDALQERSRRMIELTREEADEIAAAAREKAEQTRLDAEREAARLTERERELVAAAEAEAERGRVEREELMRRAEARRRELDEAAARRRAQLEEDHAIAMNVRRADALRELAAQADAAKAKADRLVEAATTRGAELITDAEREVAALNEVRDKLVASLSGSRALLAQAAVALGPADFDPEATTPLGRLPVQRRSPSDDLSDAVG